MRQFRIFGLVLIVMVAISGVQANDKVPSGFRAGTAEHRAGLIDTFIDATALLYALDEEGSYKMLCTATAFEKDAPKKSKLVTYRFVTASHCVAENDEKHERPKLRNANLFLTFDEAAAKTFLEAKVVAVGYQKIGDDFAVLEIEVDTDIPVMPLASSPASMSERMCSIASPGGLGKQYFEGYVSMPKLARPVEVNDNDWQGTMILQMHVAGGSSGSAVFSVEQGGIAAFTIGFYGDSQNLVALPVERFTAFWEAFKKGEYKWYKAPNK